MPTSNPQFKKLQRGYTVMAVVGLFFIGLFGKGIDLFVASNTKQKAAADMYINSDKVLKSV